MWCRQLLDAVSAEVDDLASASGRGARSARSSTETAQPSAPKATMARGAAASHWFIAPHSSASTWPKLIHRNRFTGITRATASATDGNIERFPQWKSSGSSESIKNWLYEKPRGPTSAAKVESR
jgi:hypothetical protein